MDLVLLDNFTERLLSEIGRESDVFISREITNRQMAAEFVKLGS